MKSIRTEDELLRSG